MSRLEHHTYSHLRSEFLAYQKKKKKSEFLATKQFDKKKLHNVSIKQAGSEHDYR